ncbi:MULTISPECIES: ATP-binding protein [unclassified Rhizobium]|uniref:ATP-binding protein n=1 Tax=unclassified Rhizobium TaxID=2613769 RepID=UPI001A982AB3|nr:MULTISPECIES: ATP-binding protein [unclassified Rhizobium]MBX5167464.1 two-component sensor histidine kinase [Rhizobium sp. NZLR4b]MBX5173088.1 two-component sensor histidine kinase [Rhizobium sp. NZLR1b]MBX5186244.1 two-component sensor histidine kinase [Rhizobium sp. NZLR5]MBX5191909.1 two-component sensor histidine kinase [Rhizobium sp. NZLR3b]MBX5204682.1 two-component sensor histidine kinase [Rhizobium sp. NZLR1]
MSQSRATLGAILARRIAFFALFAMLLQLAIVFSDYYWNVGELSRLFVEQETERLAAGITVEESSIRYRLPDSVQQRYHKGDSGYVARIRAANGALVFQSCDAACEDRFLPTDVNPPDFWLRSLVPGKPLSLVGGRAFVIANQRFLVDIATIGDPSDIMSDVLWNEVIEHLIVPMSILLVLVLGGTLLSVRQALRPVRAAADAADRIDPMDSRSHLDFDQMPREVAHLAAAVNRAFERVGELMMSQKVLTSGIAHEIRTPLAALKLELGHIDDPRARRAEADLDDLVNFVAQLTALARLDSVDHGMFEEVDLVELTSSVVAQLAPWVYENKHSLEFFSQVESTIFRGAPSLLRDAVRNLIENAVRHTPDHTVVIVCVGNGTIAVEDRSPKLSPLHKSASSPPDSLGIGLKIVGRIVEIHQASFSTSRSNSGHIVELDFR